MKHKLITQIHKVSLFTSFIYKYILISIYNIQKLYKEKQKQAINKLHLNSLWL